MKTKLQIIASAVAFVILIPFVLAWTFATSLVGLAFLPLRWTLQRLRDGSEHRRFRRAKRVDIKVIA